MFRYYLFQEHTYVRIQICKPIYKILAVNNSEEVKGIVHYKENLKITGDYQEITKRRFEKNFEDAKYFLIWEGNRKLKLINKPQDERATNSI